MIPALGKAIPRAQRWALHIKQVVPLQLCRELIHETEQIGYQTALVNQHDGSKRFDKHVRHNLRVELYRPSLADKLLKLCHAHLPHTVIVPHHLLLPPTQKKPSERRALVNLNSHMRFSKYIDMDGHFFAPHADMSVPDDDASSASLLTLQVYLNDDYSGGETSLQRSSPNEWKDVGPIHAGDLLLFDHSLVHRANPVVLGTKYTLRSDVFYK